MFRSRPWRPARLLQSLVAGLLVTITLAWLGMFLPTGSQWYGPAPTEGLGLAKTIDGQRIWRIERGRNVWHDVVRYWHVQISGQSFMMQDEDFEPRRFDVDTLPAALRPAALDELHMMAWYHRTGFPFGALSCAVHWKTQRRNSDILYTVHGGIQLPRDGLFNPRALPLTPGIGFVADVAVWSAAWLAVVGGVGLMRDRRRHRRRRCLRCGYRLEGLPAGARCPECGGDATYRTIAR